MDARALLDQLLKSGQDLAQQGWTKTQERLDLPQEGPEREAMLSNMGKGALAAGLLGLLLGTGTGRKLTGTALKVGGLAAIGGLAYKTYKDWQAKQSGEATESAADSAHSIENLTGAQSEKRSRVLVRAMIAACKADGHVDDAERTKIEELIKTLRLDADSTRLIFDELETPLDAGAVAKGADSPEAAAEIYLVSRTVIDVDNEMERAYLDELAKSLDLAPELVRQLEDAA